MFHMPEVFLALSSSELECSFDTLPAKVTKREKSIIVVKTFFHSKSEQKFLKCSLITISFALLNMSLRRWKMIFN